MKTMPAASEIWITDIGAIDSAATCRPQLLVAISMPIVNHFEEYSSRARAQRVHHAHLRHGVRAAVLEEEAQVRHKGAGEREEYADV